jgi:hypothetical protein
LHSSPLLVICIVCIFLNFSLRNINIFVFLIKIIYFSKQSTRLNKNPYTPNKVRLRDFLVKAGRGNNGRREAGEEKNYENNLLPPLLL